MSSISLTGPENGIMSLVIRRTVLTSLPRTPALSANAPHQHVFVNFPPNYWEKAKVCMRSRIHQPNGDCPQAKSNSPRTVSACPVPTQPSSVSLLRLAPSPRSASTNPIPSIPPPSCSAPPFVATLPPRCHFPVELLPSLSCPRPLPRTYRRRGINLPWVEDMLFKIKMGGGERRAKGQRNISAKPIPENIFIIHEIAKHIQLNWGNYKSLRSLLKEKHQVCVK